MAKNGYTIRLRGTSWQVDFAKRSAGGKRIQKSFKTKAKATSWAVAKQQELTVLGKAAFDLSDNEKKTALDAFKKLKDQGFPFGTLLDAVDFYTQHHDPAKAKRTVQKANRRPNTIRDLHQRIGRFAQDFGNRLAHEQSPIGRKVELLQKEGVRVKNGRVENFREHLHVFST
ncbi:MAG: hypothetical protein QGG69_06655 [Kiritimatiellia bacterium]|jgi:hypothetical protein|nr:hypothetical protein [Kiritimatiellia bacterium]